MGQVAMVAHSCGPTGSARGLLEPRSSKTAWSKSLCPNTKTEMSWGQGLGCLFLRISPTQSLELPIPVFLATPAHEAPILLPISPQITPLLSIAAEPYTVTLEISGNPGASFSYNQPMVPDSQSEEPILRKVGS